MKFAERYSRALRAMYKDVSAEKIVDKLKAAGVPYEYEIFEGYGHAAFDEIKEYKDRILQFLQR